MEIADEKPVNSKIRVKPLYGAMIHSDSQEGPCRIGTFQELSPEAERRTAKESLKRFQHMMEGLSPEARLLDPAYMEYGEDFTVPEEEFEKLEGDIDDVDIFLLSYRVPGIERYGKPVAMIGKGITNVDIAAYLRHRGLEGYAPLNIHEFNDLVSSLKVRKAFSRTRVLVVYKDTMISGRQLRHPAGVYSSIGDLDLWTKNVGVDFSLVTFEEFFEEMDRAEAERGEEAAEITRRLIGEAQEVFMEEKDITNSVIPYLAAEALLRKHRCNAFTIPCFTLCTSKVPAERRFTPCLTHTLLKDRGIPSSCEADLNALMAMALLMYCSGRSAFMGNPFVEDIEGSTLRIGHDVPGLKMKGFDGPDLPYNIRPFTKGGWGVTVRYDFPRDKGQEVTVARFNPSGTRLLATRGEIVDGGGFDSIGCSLSVLLKVPDAAEFIHRQADFGHHSAMVYGDYTEKLRQISGVMGYDLELV
jgi:hypothetical protein